MLNYDQHANASELGGKSKKAKKQKKNQQTCIQPIHIPFPPIR